MKTHRDPDMDKLNAFVDRQLDAEEHERLLLEAATDGATAARVAELRQIKALVQHAYRQPPPAPRPQPRRAAGGRSRSWWLLAPLLALGLAGGWVSHQIWEGRQSGAAEGPLIARFDPAAARADHIVLHVETSDARRVRQALDEVERRLGQLQAEGRHARLEIVANGEGIDLIRVGTRDLEAHRLQALLERFDEVTIAACRKTLRRLREQGTAIRLLPETDTSQTALDQIVRRMREGWLYIKA